MSSKYQPHLKRRKYPEYEDYKMDALKMDRYYVEVPFNPAPQESKKETPIKKPYYIDE